MNIVKFQSQDADQLIVFLSQNTWPFHVYSSLSSTQIAEKVAKGYYENGRETFWLIVEEQHIGLLIIEDIEDAIVTIDIRLAQQTRGKGYGVQALRWLQHYIFEELGKIRIEGYTRADNIAMQKCFLKAGFTQEGFLRKSWENIDGTVFDSYLFAVIDDDWQQKRSCL